MKCIISAFLLVITTFASLRTSWDLHFCGSILQSVSIADRFSDCCCGYDDGDKSGNASDLFLINQFCCYDYRVDLATDNFDLSRPFVGTTLYALNLFWGTDMMSILFKPVYFTVLPCVFPTGICAKYGADLLILICVFRI
jgi:hypothetical protein